VAASSALFVVQYYFQRQKGINKHSEKHLTTVLNKYKKGIKSRRQELAKKDKKQTHVPGC
jgi:hypothetical protein